MKGGSEEPPFRLMVVWPPFLPVGGFHSIVQYVPVMPSWAQRQFRASPTPRCNDAFDGHRHDLTRAHKLPCETIHLVLVILAARRNEVFPRHGAASHYIPQCRGPRLRADVSRCPSSMIALFRGTDDQRTAPVERFRPPFDGLFPDDDLRRERLAH